VRFIAYQRSSFIQVFLKYCTLDNIFFNCITERGLEKGMWHAMEYGDGEVFVQKIYSWSDDT